MKITSTLNMQTLLFPKHLIHSLKDYNYLHSIYIKHRKKSRDYSRVYWNLLIKYMQIVHHLT